MKVYPKKKNNLYYGSHNSIFHPLLSIPVDKKITSGFSNQYSSTHAISSESLFYNANSIVAYTTPCSENYYIINSRGNIILLNSNSDFNFELICSVSLTNVSLFREISTNELFGSHYSFIIDLYPELFEVNIDSDYYLLCKQNKENLDSLYLKDISSFIRNLIKFAKLKSIKINYIENHKDDLTVDSKLNKDDLIVPKLNLENPELNIQNIKSELKRRYEKVEEKSINFQLEFDD